MTDQLQQLASAVQSLPPPQTRRFNIEKRVTLWDRFLFCAVLAALALFPSYLIAGSRLVIDKDQPLAIAVVAGFLVLFTVGAAIGLILVWLFLQSAVQSGVERALEKLRMR